MSALKLYHNALSTCSQKVRFVLAEKNIDFESHEIDLMAGEQHQDWYVKLNPKHVVPTIEHDGRILTESSLIIQYLEALSKEPELTPTDPYARYEVGQWIRLVDDEVHPAAPIITFAIGPRPLILQQPEEVREANINAMPNERARAIRRSVIEHGVNAPEFGDALRTFIKMLDRMESRLVGQTWLVEDRVSLAEASVLAYVVRMDDMAMGSLFDHSIRPNVANWFENLKALPSFKKAVDEWTPDFVRDMFRQNGEAVWPDIEAQLN